MANQISSKLGSWKFQAHRRPFPMKPDTHYIILLSLDVLEPTKGKSHPRYVPF